MPLKLVVLKLERASESLLKYRFFGLTPLTPRVLESGDLGWSLSICISYKSQIMVMLLVQKPHLENIVLDESPSHRNTQSEGIVLCGNWQVFASQGFPSGFQTADRIQVDTNNIIVTHFLFEEPAQISLHAQSFPNNPMSKRHFPPLNYSKTVVFFYTRPLGICGTFCTIFL